MGMGAARTIPVLFVLAAFCGCAAPSRVCPQTSTNLALGRVASVNRLAQESNLRSGWPSIESGYMFDDVTYFSSSSYDRQYFYDRLGGEFENLSQSIRTGVRVR